MKGKKAIAYLRDIENLGEFKFIFNRTPLKDIKEGTDKFLVEAFFNPDSYGKVDFLLGSYHNNIEDEIAKLEDEDDYIMDYFINCARISCEFAVEFNEDTEGVYEELLMNYFGYTKEDIDRMIENGKNEL